MFLHRTAAEPPPRSPQVRWAIPRFIVLFGILFGILTWLLDGNGPLERVNERVISITHFQTRVAAQVLQAAGENVTAEARCLVGRSFSCEVDTGCNGMVAASLFLAAILSFPAHWRLRVYGSVALLPVILGVNILRVSTLYWMGTHRPQWFSLAHIYVGQVVVIAATTCLWLLWLSWNPRRPSA